jgi:hypothetical protein
MASKKPKITVTFDHQKMEEIQRYAESTGLTPANLLKYALQQHMNRYPKRFHQDGGKDRLAVQPEASAGKPSQRAG